MSDTVINAAGRFDEKRRRDYIQARVVEMIASGERPVLSEQARKVSERAAEILREKLVD